MNCSSCQHENREGASFCEACGTHLAAACSGCGNELRPEARFCDACGTPVDAAGAAAETSERSPSDYTPKHLADRILRSKSTLEGERKHVTVLFADVANYTRLSEGTDPEDMHSIMDRCFQIILAQVHRYEGTINQFTGDGVMALFGAPLALEDAPRRAVTAALAIQEALVPFGQEVLARHRAEFKMRIGINTGPVVVARIGDDLRMDYTAIGDTTNLAARLEALALPGSILVSEATEHLVEGFFDVEDLGAMGVKGKSVPVHAFQVLGERGIHDRIEAAVSAGLSPLVGRERELDALSAAFDSAREGRGQVAFLVGEAGIGKSRLLYEFRQQLQGEPHIWFGGRCASYGQNTAYLCVVDALQISFGIDDRDDDAGAVAKLDEGVRSLGSDLEWTLPFVRQLLSLPPGEDRVAEMDSPARRSETIRALHAILHGAAERQPLVLVIEDLHWIDAASEEFLGFLAESIPASRALFLFTHRPGYRHPFGDRSYHVRLALQPLSERQTSSLAGSLLEGSALPEPLERLIAAKADGNPFFVEEVTKSLLDDGSVRVENGRVELAKKLEDVSVPDSIQDVLMARIDRLDDEPKRAIQLASVIGREFALRLLEKISEVGDRLDSVVGELRALELIYEKTVHPELAFMFKHALTHDVAYESVLLQRRKALHRIVGHAIEELYQDRLVEHHEALAHHFTRGEEWEKALHYHDLAARKSMDAFANHAAAEHCRQALAIAERLGTAPERRIELEGRLASILYLLGDLSPSAEANLRAAELHGDSAPAALHYALASSSFLWAHDYPRGLEAADRALEMGKAHGSDAAVGVALQTRCLHNDVHGHFGPQSVEDGKRAAELAERSDNGWAIIWTLPYYAIVCKHVGHNREAIAVSERALAVARRDGLADAMPAWALGLALGGIGHYGRATALFSAAIEFCDRIGLAPIKARLMNSLGWLLAEMGCHDRARRYNEGCAELAAEMVKADLVAGAPELYANGKVNLAGNLLMLGETDAADEALEPIRRQLDVPGDPWMRWRYSLHVLDAEARLARAQRAPERALEFVERELDAARGHSANKLVARALELKGRVLLDGDARHEAEEALAEALRLAREIEYPPVIWRSLSLLAELDRRSGSPSEARRRARQARTLVDELSGPLPEDLQREFRAMGEDLEVDPLGAYR